CDVSSTGAQVYPAVLTDDAAGGDPAVVLSTFPVSLVKTLLNIDSFEACVNQFSGLLVPRANLVTGKTYGFYVYTIGVGEDIANPDNTDTITSNNFVYVPIKWDCNLSVDEMIKGAKKESLTVYPNPASTEVNFDYIFDANSTTAVARITDITGRTVLVKDFGKSNGFGTRKFKVDVSALPAGTYIMEFSTDNKRAVSKFSIK
ncbi:MAG: T9SS type A sorting domain-containing protein, partial [Pedobacter sp.]